MRWVRALMVLGLLLAPRPMHSEALHGLGAGMTFRFDESQQKHPNVGTLAIPITAPVEGYDGIPLTFSAMYYTVFRMGDDSRNSKGKVILQIQVIRNDRVLWQARKKSRIKYDRYTTNECGNCTHKLHFRNKFNESLQAGDLVLFRFKFKRMPRFETGEAAQLSGGIW